MAFILISLKNLKTVVKWFQQFREDGLAFCRTWHDSTGSVFALWCAFDTLFFFLFLHNAQEIITYFLHPKTGLKKATLAYDTSEKSRDILWLEKKLVNLLDYSPTYIIFIYIVLRKFLWLKCYTILVLNLCPIIILFSIMINLFSSVWVSHCLSKT